MATTKKTASNAAAPAAKKPAQARKTAPAEPAAEKLTGGRQKKAAKPALKTRLQPDAPWPFPTGKRP